MKRFLATLWSDLRFLIFTDVRVLLRVRSERSSIKRDVKKLQHHTNAELGAHINRKPFVTQHLIPAPGRMVVVREPASDKVGAIYKTDETVEWETHTNPFAMVVGVGDAQINQYTGERITTDVLEGDKVILGALGMAVPLVSEGKIDYVYVVGFESVVGRLELICGACGHHERNFAHEIKCPKCGAGAAPELIPEAPSEIVMPTLDEVADISAERIRKASK